MLLKVGVQFINYTGEIGTKVYSFIIDSSELKKLNEHSIKTTYKITSGNYTYGNSVIFIYMREADPSDIQTYKKKSNQFWLDLVELLGLEPRS